MQFKIVVRYYPATLAKRSKRCMAQQIFKKNKKKSKIKLANSFPAANYMFKVKNRNTKTRC